MDEYRQQFRSLLVATGRDQLDRFYEVAGEHQDTRQAVEAVIRNSGGEPGDWPEEQLSSGFVEYVVERLREIEATLDWAEGGEPPEPMRELYRQHGHGDALPEVAPLSLLEREVRVTGRLLVLAEEQLP